MRFSVLGSGSGGNSAIVECGDLRLLVDAGLSSKQLSLRLRDLGVDPATLDGILLTHEHGDHTRGLRVFLKQFAIPVYATPMTARVVREANLPKVPWKAFEAGQSFNIGQARISTYTVHHDAVDPVGFVIGNGNTRRLGILSDAGHITQSMRQSLLKLSTLFVEANYDEELLEADTRRPWSTKQRISSRHGHLSNHQTAGLLEDISHEGLQQVVLGHLSSDCNCPDRAIKTMQKPFPRLANPMPGWTVPSRMNQVPGSRSRAKES